MLYKALYYILAEASGGLGSVVDKRLLHLSIIHRQDTTTKEEYSVGGGGSIIFLKSVSPLIKLYIYINYIKLYIILRLNILLFSHEYLLWGGG